MGVGLLSHTGEYRSIELPVYSLKSADVKIYVEERGRSLGLWAIREGLLRPRWPLGRCFPSLHRTGNTGTEYAFRSLLEELQERNLKSRGKVRLVNTGRALWQRMQRLVVEVLIFSRRNLKT